MKKNNEISADTITTTKIVKRKFNERLDDSMLIIRLRDYKIFSLNVILAETLFEIFAMISESNAAKGVKNKAINSSLRLLKKWKETCDDVVSRCRWDESEELFDNYISMINDTEATGRMFFEALDSINQDFDIVQFENTNGCIYNFGDDDFLIVTPRIMNFLVKETFLEVAEEKCNRC